MIKNETVELDEKHGLIWLKEDDAVLFQNPNDGSSRVSVVVTEQTAQSLAPQNHTCGGFWNAPDRAGSPVPRGNELR